MYGHSDRNPKYSRETLKEVDKVKIDPGDTFLGSPYAMGMDPVSYISFSIYVCAHEHGSVN